MSQEKYMQHYVEILTATMNDCIVRNVSMQANAKIKDELVEQLNEKILEFKQANEELVKAYSELKEQKEKSDSENLKSLNAQLNNSNNELNDLKSQLALLTKYRVECETLKTQLANVETFRKELIRERENHQSTKDYYENKIKELNEELELSKTPVKTKKVVKKVDALELEKAQDNIVNLIKDGGIF